MFIFLERYWRTNAILRNSIVRNRPTSHNFRPVYVSVDNVVCVFNGLDVRTVGHVKKIKRLGEKEQKKKIHVSLSVLWCSPRSMCTSDPNSNRTHRIDLDLAVKETQKKRFRLHPYDGSWKRETETDKSTSKSLLTKLTGNGFLRVMQKRRKLNNVLTWIIMEYEKRRLEVMGMCGYGEESTTVLREIGEGKIIIIVSVLKRKAKFIGRIY